MAKGELKIVKVKGEENVADGLTKHVDRQKMEQYMEHAAWCGGVVDMSLVRNLETVCELFFLLETVLVRVVVFCPSGRWRHLVLACFFGDGLSIWETVAAAMAVKMNFQRRLLNLRRQFRHYREGELREETVQL